MEHILYMALLYEYYGRLLTEKQKSIFEMHYNEDMSLAEISEITKVSPQGIFDMLKRTEKLLLNFEKKTGLVALREKDRLNLLFVKEKLNELRVKYNEENHRDIDELLYVVDDFLKSFD